jgi:hypothetical protein
MAADRHVTFSGGQNLLTRNLKQFGHKRQVVSLNPFHTFEYLGKAIQQLSYFFIIGSSITKLKICSAELTDGTVFIKNQRFKVTADFYIVFFKVKHIE